MGAGEIVLACFFGLIVLGVPLTIVVASIWVSRKTSQRGAVASQNLAADQPFELAIPAGPALSLMLSYTVHCPGSVRHANYGMALRARLTRGPSTLDQQSMIGRGAAALPDVKQVPVAWVMGAHKSQIAGGHVEVSASALIAELPAGDAGILTGVLTLAPSTQGRGFTLFAKPK